jgi:2-iminobutanoate/2-iminopropanoate deaminase
MQTQRRSVLKKLFASLAAVTGVGIAAKANPTGSEPAPVKEVFNVVTDDQDVPLFSGSTKYGGLVFIAGKGAHTEPFEIKAHTEIVLKELEKELIKAGSSMEKVLKVKYISMISPITKP